MSKFYKVFTVTHQKNVSLTLNFAVDRSNLNLIKSVFNTPTKVTMAWSTKWKSLTFYSAERDSIHFLAKHNNEHKWIMFSGLTAEGGHVSSKDCCCCYSNVHIIAIYKITQWRDLFPPCSGLWLPEFIISQKPLHYVFTPLGSLHRLSSTKASARPNI